MELSDSQTVPNNIFDVNMQKFHMVRFLSIRRIGQRFMLMMHLSMILNLDNQGTGDKVVPCPELMLVTEVEEWIQVLLRTLYSGAGHSCMTLQSSLLKTVFYAQQKQGIVISYMKKVCSAVRSERVVWWTCNIVNHSRRIYYSRGQQKIYIHCT
jgi:hypothetical protein